MTDLSLAQHSDGSARCGFTSSAISMNSAIQSRRTTRSTNYAALVIGRCGSIHSGFGSAIQTCHKEAPGRAPRASGLPKYPPARPRQDAPQRPNARINVRFAPKATEVLRCREASLCARSGCEQSQQSTPLFDHLVGEGEQPVWNFDAKRLRGLDVDHQLKLGRQHYRQITRFLAFEDAGCVYGGLSGRQRNNPFPLGRQEHADAYVQRASSMLDECCKSGLDLAVAT